MMQMTRKRANAVNTGAYVLCNGVVRMSEVDRHGTAPPR
jgi:hypothetical protein